MNTSSSMQDPRSAVAGGRQLDIARILSPVTLAIGLRNVARGALLGFGAGAVIGIGIMLVDHVRTFGFAMPAAFLAIVLGVLSGVGVGIARWPRALEAARTADLYFHLDDRLTTALELREADTPVAVLQSHDVARRIDGLTLSRSRGRWFHPREGVMVGVAALAFAAALTLGSSNGHHRVAVAASSQNARARHTAASQVRKLTSQLHLGLTPTQLQSPAMRKLDLALSRLRRQLLHATSPRAGLRAISATQRQLRQIASGLHPVNARAVAQLNSSLSRYVGKNQSRGSSKTPSRSPLATAQALNRLAQSLPHLTPAQRAALARALAKSANATSNNALRSTLRQAASSLANSDTQSATAALQQAAQTLSQSASARASLARAGAAGSQLDTIKNQIAGTGTAPPSSPSSAQQGRPGVTAGRQGTGHGKGKTPGTGAGAGKGRGTRPGQSSHPGQGAGRQGTAAGRGLGQGQGRGAGQGRAAGQGRGVGQGTVATLGSGTSGGHGNGGRGRPGVTRKGRNVTVFIPGKQGKGAEIVRNGPKGAPALGSLVPYQQVVGQYTQSAHQALDRAALPPSLQGYVRRYFSTLSR